MKNLSIYNSTDYLRLEARRQNSKLAQYNYENGDQNFTVDYLIRKNPSDIVSPYGYTGYYYNGDEEFLQKSLDKFQSFLSKNGFVSAFLRNKLVSDYVENSTECVYIDLTKDIEVQFNSNQKRKLKKLQNLDFVVTFDKVDSIQFNKIYNTTMDRVNAKDFYYFGEEYFSSLAEIDSVFQTNVIDLDTSEIICSGIFFEEGEYHLGATKDEYVKLSPSSLMISETSKFFKNNFPTKKLNLGGGNEKLLQFKKSFSKSVQYFTTHQWVLNRAEYERLSILNFDQSNKNFPLYRN